MNIHLIAIGGAVMHNLALALNENGHNVTGSDDEIYEPAATRLRNAGLLPKVSGWHESSIHDKLDAVILGMHAKADNPELLRAQALGLKVYSFPEFIYEQSRDKQRVVIAGSHGKTTITSMVLHVLKALGRKFDYLVGAQIEGFDTMVRLSNDAPFIVLEGDEYLSSPIDRRPKFLLYQPHLVLISGIAWDHINVFPTEEDYNRQFQLLLHSVPKAGVIVYYEKDKLLKQMVNAYVRPNEQYLHPYTAVEYRVRNGVTEIWIEGNKTTVSLIGKHNLQNIAGAWEVCKLLAVDAADFAKHIATFKGAAKRLEKLFESDKLVLFKDFAHAPSKVKATVQAAAEFYPRFNIVACLELHTFSSLNKNFISQYKKTLREAHKKIIFIDKHSLQKKNYPPISKQELTQAFEEKDLQFAETPEELRELVKKNLTGNSVLLMMSSGNWAGLDLVSLA